MGSQQTVRTVGSDLSTRKMLQKWIRTLRLCSPEKLHQRARLALSPDLNLQKFSHES